MGTSTRLNSRQQSAAENLLLELTFLHRMITTETKIIVMSMASRGATRPFARIVSVRMSERALGNNHAAPNSRLVQCSFRTEARGRRLLPIWWPALAQKSFANAYCESKWALREISEAVQNVTC